MLYCHSCIFNSIKPLNLFSLYTSTLHLSELAINEWSFSPGNNKLTGNNCSLYDYYSNITAHTEEQNLVNWKVRIYKTEQSIYKCINACVKCGKVCVKTIFSNLLLKTWWSFNWRLYQYLCTDLFVPFPTTHISENIHWYHSLT